MEKEIEEFFVKTFIMQNKQDRILHELCHEKKRINALSRFCHRTNEHIKETKIIYFGNDISINELQKYIDITKEKQGYVISYDKSLDAKWFKKDEVLSLIIGRGMPSIAVFNHLAIIETEQTQGPAQKFVLKS